MGTVSLPAQAKAFLEVFALADPETVVAHLIADNFLAFDIEPEDLVGFSGGHDPVPFFALISVGLADCTPLARVRRAGAEGLLRESPLLRRVVSGAAPREPRPGSGSELELTGPAAALGREGLRDAGARRAMGARRAAVGTLLPGDGHARGR